MEYKDVSVRNKIMRYSALFIILTATGCAQLDIVRSAINIQGAQAADRILNDAEFVMCRGITIGAWTRKYGGDEQMAGAWKTICGGPPLVALP